MLVLGVPDELRNHLTRALVEHCRWCRTNGIPVPAEVSDLLDHLAHGGQGRTNVAPAEEGAHDESVLLLVDYAAAGRRLDVSERTVRRLVSAGRLPAVDVGGCRRIRVTDLADYVAGLQWNTSK